MLSTCVLDNLRRVDAQLLKFVGEETWTVPIILFYEGKAETFWKYSRLIGFNYSEILGPIGSYLKINYNNKTLKKYPSKIIIPKTQYNFSLFIPMIHPLKFSLFPFPLSKISHINLFYLVNDDIILLFIIIRVDMRR